MDISAATTLAAGIVALIAPALIQAFKKYIPADYVGMTSLGMSILLDVLAIVATSGLRLRVPGSSEWRRPSTRSSTKRSTAS
ncbi:hypothetical protein [Bifidobacterium callitrichos]|uniref:hypothetical protein n=1 Tax=Bifidobacterium callitrichos TaxID=762209 RepID=UPI00295EC158|nr:hypothetical protein [Bifidobacterium callitrichos]